MGTGTKGKYKYRKGKNPSKKKKIAHRFKTGRVKDLGRIKKGTQNLYDEKRFPSRRIPKSFKKERRESGPTMANNEQGRAK